MAEEENKQFHMFTVKMQGDKHDEKLEKSKSKVSLADISKDLLGDDPETGDNMELAQKLKAAIAEELKAVDAAIKNKDYNKAGAYHDAKGKIDAVQKLFAADDDFEKRVDPALQQLHEECAVINAEIEPLVAKKEQYEKEIARLQAKEDATEGSMVYRNQIKKFQALYDTATDAAEKDRYARERDRIQAKYDETEGGKLAIQRKAQEEERGKVAREIITLENNKEKIGKEYAPYLASSEEHRAKEQKACEWVDSLEALEKTPSKVLANLLKFQQECKAKGDAGEKDFTKVYEDFTAEKDGPFAPSQKKDGTIINEHQFGYLNDGRVKHSILNLKDTGLNICWIGDEIGLIHSTEELSPEQLKAFAEYCFSNGVSIEQAGKLENLKVVDKKGKLQGSFIDELDKEMERLQEEASRQGGPDKAKLEDGEINYPSRGVNDETEYHGSFYDFLPPIGEIKATRAEMVAKTKARIGMMGFDSDNLLNVTRGWNTTVISVYASENDRIADNEVDKKGKRSDTKQFSVELTHTNPPTGRIYLPAGKKPSADLARTTLDAFGVAGCKYFIMPGADKIGKEFAGCFMKASVKTGMVPYLASSKNGKGCFVGAADLTTILEELPKEPGLSPKEKVEYQMRWSEQLEKYMGWNTKARSKIGTLSAKFKQGALFGMFTNSYLDNLQDHIEKGMNGELGDRQWDSVDQVTATAAMAKIIKDIQNGTLNGKPYNPLGDNDAELKKTLEIYMKLERPVVEKEINDNLATLEKTGERDMTGKMKNLVSSAFRARKEVLDKTVNGLKSYGVEMQPKIVAAKKDYEHNRDGSARPTKESNIPANRSQQMMNPRNTQRGSL